MDVGQLCSPVQHPSFFTESGGHEGKSLKRCSLVGGTVLNAINQGAEILGGKPMDLVRLLLTYAVPFFVASYGAYSAFARLETFRD